MKTVMNKKGTKGFAVLAFALVSMMMSGCGKSDNGNNNNGVVNPYAVGYGACTACGAMTQPFVSTVGEDSYPESLQLQLFTTQAVPNGTFQYAGAQQIAAQGTFTIPSGDPVCGIAPGTYQVTTLQPGQYNGSQSVSNLVLQAVGGPSQVTIYIRTAYLNLTANAGYPANTTYPNAYPYPSTYGLGTQQAQTRFLAKGYLNNNPNCGFALN